MPQRKVKQQNEQQKSKSFEKVLNRSSVPPNSSLFLPASFVREHGDEIRIDVTLKNAKSGESFKVKCTVNFPRGRPSVLFSGGWRAFAVANELTINDHLTFEVVAMSTFLVTIKRTGRSSEASYVPHSQQLPFHFRLEGRQASAHARAKRAAIRATAYTSAATKLNLKENEHVVAPEAPQAASITNFGNHGQLLGQMRYRKYKEIAAVTEQGIPKGL